MRPLIAVLVLVTACGKDPKPEPAGGNPPTKTVEKETAQKPAEKPAPMPWFVDEAKKRGVNQLNRTGKEGKKDFIMSAVGPGAALFDADGDGRLDIYIPNGNRLMPPRFDTLYEGEDRPRNALYMQQEDGTFVDQATERGVNCDRWGFGATAADVDNDGDQDLLVANLFFNRLYLNDGTGKFRDVAVEAGVAGEKVEWSTCIAVGDVNSDGIPDLYVANYADMFEWMRTNDMIVRKPNGEIVKAAVCPWQKLEVYCGPRGLPAQQDHLYLGRGLKDGIPQYEEVTKASGILRPGKSETRHGPAWGFQVLIADFNHDKKPDIFVSNDSAPSHYFENRGAADGAEVTFEECAGQRGVAFSSMGDKLAGMGADIGDINRDGHFDMIKTNFSLQTYNLYIAEWFKGRMDWVEYSMRTGVDKAVWSSLGWGAILADIDHDGDLDIYFANGHVYPEVDSVPQLGMKFKQNNQLFLNRLVEEGKLKVDEVSTEAGPGLAIVESSRGSSSGDLDNDGDIDYVIVNLNGMPNLLYNQRGSEQGRWLLIDLVGDVKKKSTRDAYGAIVKVESGAGTQYLQNVRARGFLGSCDPRLHVGLGQKPGEVTITVTWPDGSESVVKTSDVDRVVQIKQ